LEIKYADPLFEFIRHCAEGINFGVLKPGLFSQTMTASLLNVGSPWAWGDRTEKQFISHSIRYRGRVRCPINRTWRILLCITALSYPRRVFGFPGSDANCGHYDDRQDNTCGQE